MTKPIIVLPLAAKDIEEHWFWLAIRDFGAAERFLDRLDEVYEVIGVFPESGSPRPELGRDLRSLVADQHLVFYRVTDNHIDVVRILAARRDIKRTAFD